jgi:hypothetical protein
MLAVGMMVLVLVRAFCSGSAIAQNRIEPLSKAETGMGRSWVPEDMKKLELSTIVGDQLKSPSQYSHALINLQNSIKTLTGIPAVIGPQLRLGSPEIRQRPILIVSANGQFELTVVEIKNLREYIENGGFLLFDDAGANIPNNPSGTAIRAAVREIAGQNKLMPVPPDHPIFQTPFLLEGPPSGLVTPAYILYPKNAQERQAWEDQKRYSDKTQPLAGVFIGSRLALLNSPRGYYAMWNDAKNESQLKFGVNIVMYALGLE